MNMPLEMNMQVARTEDAEIRFLADNELDDVNGGFFWAIPYLVVGFVYGYGVTRAILSRP